MTRRIAIRPATIGCAIAAARALLAQPAPRRPFVLWRMLREAARAEAYRQASGRMHPVWGDGTLMASALRRPCTPEPSLEDADYRKCLIAVLTALGPQPFAQDRQSATAGFVSSRARAIASPQSVQ